MCNSCMLETAIKVSKETKGLLDVFMENRLPQYSKYTYNDTIKLLLEIAEISVTK
jgi:hypothetical protein